MKKITVLLILLTSFYLFPMSGDSNEIDPKMEKYKLTQEELQNIAVNYYYYEFEEEHEWKGVRIDSSKSVIKNITPLKDGDITLAYIVNYNPGGNVFISAYKNMPGPFQSTGGGNDTWSLGVKEGFLSVDDKEFQHPLLAGFYKKLSKALREGRNLTSGEQEIWKKYIKSPDQFKEKADYSKDPHPPKWWLKKKALKKEANP